MGTTELAHTVLTINTTVLIRSVISFDTDSGRESVGAEVNQLAVVYRLTAKLCQMECFLASPG